MTALPACKRCGSPMLPHDCTIPTKCGVNRCTNKDCKTLLSVRANGTERWAPPLART